jgi:hypothetical protein
MVLSVVLDDLDRELTKSSAVATAIGDSFLVYLIDMAILHVRKKAIHTEDRGTERLRKARSADNRRRSEDASQSVYAGAG